jgi:hypothetical protein
MHDIWRIEKKYLAKARSSRDYFSLWPITTYGKAMTGIVAKKSRKISLLFFAAAIGCSIVAGGAYLASRNADSLLQKAARHGIDLAIDPLLWVGADINSAKGSTLWLAASQGHTRTVELLLDRGADVHVDEDMPLRLAAMMGHTETVAVLLKRGADFNAQEDGALRWSHEAGKLETTKFLCGYADGHPVSEESQFKQICRPRI